MQVGRFVFGLVSAGSFFAGACLFPSTDDLIAPTTTVANPSDASVRDQATATTCGALICDGFENPVLDSDLWIANTTSPGSMSAPGAQGTIQIDSIQAHWGSRSLHLHIDPITSGSVGQAFVSESRTLISTPNSSFARAFFFVPHVLEEGFTTFGYTQSGPPWEGIFVGITPNKTLSYHSSVVNPGVDQDLATSFPLSHWFCLEMEVDFQAVNGSVRIWVDGTEVTSFNRVQTTQANPPIGYFQVGPLVYFPNSNVSATDVWIDDVMVDTKRIGCEAKAN